MNRVFNFLFVVMTVLLVSPQSYSQSSDLLEKSFSGQSAEANPEDAKRQIQEQGFQKISEDIVQELIGLEKFVKNKALIQKKIIQQSSKFIPYTKQSPVVLENGVSKMTLTLKISVGDLKAMLKDIGMIQANDILPQILPMISFQDKANYRDFRWWKNQSNTDNLTLVRINKNFEESLRGGFKKNGLYVLKPMDAHLFENIKNYSWGDKMTHEDQQLLGNYFQAPLVIEGAWIVEKNPENPKAFKLEVKLSVIQLSNQKIIADVSRKYETESGNPNVVIEQKIKEVSESLSNDLSTQVFEVWQKGSFEALSYRLTLKGVVPLQLQDRLKDHIRSQSQTIKSLSERLLENDSISYEMSATDDIQKFTQTLRVIEFESMKFNFSKIVGNEVIYQLVQ